MNHSLRLSSPLLEGNYEASKWTKIAVLLDDTELEALWKALVPFFLYNVSEVRPTCEVDPLIFLQEYQLYIQALKEGRVPDEKKARRCFSSVLSITQEALYAMEVFPGKFLAKVARPAIQIQLHHFLPSEVDGKFYSMALSSDTISWGLLFSYPQFFQDPKDKTIKKVVASEEFPNTTLFNKLSRWIKEASVPTTFVWKEKKTPTVFRIGKKCFPWIAHHPKLQEKGVQVYVY